VERFAESLGKVGAALTKSAEEYNKAIGTLDSRVLPSARRLRNLGVTTDDEIPTPERVDVVVRQVSAVELKSLPDNGTN